jgi:hypothetical protein
MTYDNAIGLRRRLKEEGLCLKPVP